ncbi:RraA family protein [Streptomyces sp. NPDC056975]|uniref:RraA family protein n=1 Tax=Streptomyces sp. NPDC056975 TaxID=3345985 RepID=UPI003630F4D5
MRTPLFDDGVSAAQVSDSLDAAGVRGQVLDAVVRPLRRGMRAVGRAHTIQFAPVERDEDDPYRDFIRFMDTLGSGDVAVVSTGGNPRTAYWGELFSAAAKGRGAAGVVCDSYVRDSGRILDLDFPVFSAGVRPLDYRARMRVVSVGEPVTCAGVRVAPGDIVLAEDDGVVVVPTTAEDGVVARANARARAESTVLSELLAGATLGEVWARHGVL